MSKKIIVITGASSGFGRLTANALAKAARTLEAVQLRQMEVEGLVSPEVFAQAPPKVFYTLKERGQSLRPVLRSSDWRAGGCARRPHRRRLCW
jgi:DNA-binding HxlR family transcriptional regulator